MCGFITEYLDLIDYNQYTVRCCTTYEYVFVYTCLPLCSVAILLLLQQLLLAAAVRHRVPDGKICSRGSLHLIPVFSFSSFKHDLFSTYPLAVPSHFHSRFFYLYHISYILGITGMRGATAGVSPPRRSPPCIYIYIPHVVST